MANKNKNSQILSSQLLKQVSANLGIVLMAAAASMLVLEPPHDNEHKRAVLPSQPVMAVANEVTDYGSKNAGHERREREETGPHFTSYGVTQRTPSRAGRA